MFWFVFFSFGMEVVILIERGKGILVVRLKDSFNIGWIDGVGYGFQDIVDGFERVMLELIEDQ